MKKRIAIIADNSIEYVRLVINIWNQNDCIVLIDDDMPCSVGVKLLKEANVKELYTDNYEYSEHANEQLDVHIITKYKEEVSVIPQDLYRRYRFCESEDDALVLFSSGTTAAHKGVVLSHYAITNNALLIADRKRMNHDSRLYVYKTLAHCATFVGELLAALIVKATLFVCSKKMLLRYHLHNIENLRITHFSTNPSVISIVKTFMQKKYNMSSLQVVVCSGAQLTKELYDEMRSIFMCPILNAYGMTETGPMIASTIISKMESSLPVFEDYISVGEILDCVELKILDDKYNSVKRGEIGSIFVKTKTIMNNYLNSEVDLCDYFDTHDLGFVDENNNLYIVGRRDRMIISKGRNILPEHLESAIVKSGLVKECFITSEKDDLYGEKVICYYVEKHGLSHIEIQLKEYCLKNLARYEIPHVFYKIKKFEETYSGKKKVLIKK